MAHLYVPRQSLKEIKKKVNNGTYPTTDAFAADIHLMLDNAMTYVSVDPEPFRSDPSGADLPVCFLYIRLVQNEEGSVSRARASRGPYRSAADVLIRHRRLSTRTHAFSAKRSTPRMHASLLAVSLVTPHRARAPRCRRCEPAVASHRHPLQCPSRLCCPRVVACKSPRKYIAANTQGARASRKGDLNADNSSAADWRAGAT